jgi:hypothetical protein
MNIQNENVGIHHVLADNSRSLRRRDARRVVVDGPTSTKFVSFENSDVIIFIFKINHLSSTQNIDLLTVRGGKMSLKLFD